jgi:hypothetical protein
MISSHFVTRLNVTITRKEDTPATTSHYIIPFELGKKMNDRGEAGCLSKSGRICQGRRKTTTLEDAR